MDLKIDKDFQLVDIKKVYESGLLFHGPFFQGIKAILALEPRDIVTKFQLAPLSEDNQGQFQVKRINTFLEDVAYQSGIIWTKHYKKRASLPVKFVSVEYFIPMLFNCCYYSHIKIKESDNHKVKGDIYIYDESGRVCVFTKGMELVQLDQDWVI